MLPALAILAASALLNYQNNKQAMGRRDSIRRSMEDYQRQKAGETSAATEQLLSKQTPAERATELAKVTDERTKSLQNTVNAARATEVPEIAGKLSGDYKAKEAQVADTVANRTKRAIEQLATMGAPGEQGQRFALRFGHAAGDVDAANRASRYVGDAYMTDIDNVRPNPIGAMVSQIGMGVGGGMMGGPAGASVASGAQPNMVSPNNGTAWGSMDDGPAAYDARRARLSRGFSLWGRA